MMIPHQEGGHNQFKFNLTYNYMMDTPIKEEVILKPTIIEDYLKKREERKKVKKEFKKLKISVPNI